MGRSPLLLFLSVFLNVLVSIALYVIFICSHHACACVALGIACRPSVHALVTLPPAQNALTTFQLLLTGLEGRKR